MRRSQIQRIPAPRSEERRRCRCRDATDDSLGDAVQPIIHLVASYDEDLFRVARLIGYTITLPDAISRYLKADLTIYISPRLCTVMESSKSPHQLCDNRSGFLAWLDVSNASRTIVETVSTLYILGASYNRDELSLFIVCAGHCWYAFHIYIVVILEEKSSKVIYWDSWKFNNILSPYLCISTEDSSLSNYHTIFVGRY